jgi:hypothetical protein
MTATNNQWAFDYADTDYSYNAVTAGLDTVELTTKVASTNTTYGCNAVSKPVKGAVLELQFDRYTGGNWYSNTCGGTTELIVNFCRGADLPTYNSASNGYSRVNGPENISFSLRYNATPCIQGAALEQLSSPWGGRWVLKVYPADPGYYSGQVWIDNRLICEHTFAMAHIPNAVWRVVLHYHNYNRASFERQKKLVLLSDGGNMTGTAVTESGLPVDYVAVHDWYTKRLAALTTPDGTGTWVAYVPQGEYSVTYFKSGCAPVCHGPYYIEG